MADSYFTSFETSVALRDAGAPQDGQYARRVQFPDAPPVASWGCRLAEMSPENFVACFRADEIIEALGDRLASMYHDLVDEPWFAVIDDIPVPIHFQGDSLVEALAAAWLAVLKEGK